MIARVIAAKRDTLLRVYRHRLSDEDLQDCFSQATLELVARARAGRPFASDLHAARALEQKFASRITDEYRSSHGRSAARTAQREARGLDTVSDEIASYTEDTATIAERRDEAKGLLAALARLSERDRTLLLGRLRGLPPALIAAQHGLTIETYRKATQRATARLAREIDA